MRELSIAELDFVAGGTGECTPANSGNDYLGGADSSDVGEILIEVYEGLIEATSHVIERVANAL